MDRVHVMEQAGHPNPKECTGKPCAKNVCKICPFSALGVSSPQMSTTIRRIRTFFHQRPTGKVLVAIVLMKLFVIFILLRIFFFQPAMKGLTDDEKAERVSTAIEQK